MIELECGNCGKTQHLEAAFAGCVCRCRFCRAIQTVPGGERSRRRLFARRGPRVLHCPEGHRPKRHRRLTWLLVGVGLVGVSAAAAVVALALLDLA